MIPHRQKRGMIVRNITTIANDSRTEEEFQKLDQNHSNSGFSSPEFQPFQEPIEEDVLIGEKQCTAQGTAQLTLDPTMNKHVVELLVGEETEDISNILKNTAPELVNQDPALFPLKKRLQRLKLSPENVVLLEQLLLRSPITADLPMVEASPELMATIMNTSEKSIMSNIPTAQIFNSLFYNELQGGHLVILSSATPGPLKNITVPTLVDERVHEEMLSREMEQVAALFHLADKKPVQDAFVRSKPSQPRRRGRRRRPYTPLSDEDPPWSDEALFTSIEAVAAVPSYSLHQSNISRPVSKAMFMKEMSKGVEYILDSPPNQYFSRVQLRGSQPPPWFPGYMVALSNMSDSVELATSPSKVLLSAWKSVQPDVFPDDSLVYN